MTDPALATLFPFHSPGPIQIQGHTLWLAYWLEVIRGDRLYILFESVNATRQQGVRVAFEKYHDGLHTGTDEGNKTFLWADEGPRLRDLDMVRVHEVATLSITNCWRPRKGGRAQFAVGAAWLEPEPQPDGTVLLRASDGTTPVGTPTLVVRLVHERAGRVQRAT